MTSPKIPLIDDPVRLREAAVERGRIACERGEKRQSMFYSPDLTAEFLRGYDEQAQRQPKLWGARLPRFAPEGRPRVIDALVQRLRAHLKALRHG